jgi:hypothetical protein
MGSCRPFFLLLAKPEKPAGFEGRRYKRKANSKKTCHPEGWRYKNQIQRRRPEASGTKSNSKSRRDAGGANNLYVVEALAF